MDPVKMKKPEIDLILMANEDAYQLSEAVRDLSPYADEVDKLDYARDQVRRLLKSGDLCVNRVTRPKSEPLDADSAEQVIQASESWEPKDELREPYFTLTLTAAGQEKFLRLIGTP